MLNPKNIIMSIYSCADEIKQVLKDGIQQPPNGVMDILRQVPPLKRVNPIPDHQLNQEERLFLENVRTQLKSLGKGKDGYNDSRKNELAALIAHLNDYSTNHNDSALNALLGNIIEDLTVVKDGDAEELELTAEAQHATPPSPEVLEQYTALIKSRFLVTPLMQGEIKEQSKSNGDCYGYQMSMADSDLSPYKNNGVFLFDNKEQFIAAYKLYVSISQSANVRSSV